MTAALFFPKRSKNIFQSTDLNQDSEICSFKSKPNLHNFSLVLVDLKYVEHNYIYLTLLLQDSEGKNEKAASYEFESLTTKLGRGTSLHGNFYESRLMNSAGSISARADGLIRVRLLLNIAHLLKQFS